MAMRDIETCVCNPQHNTIVSLRLNQCATTRITAWWKTGYVGNLNNTCSIFTYFTCFYVKLEHVASWKINNRNRKVKWKASPTIMLLVSISANCLCICILHTLISFVCACIINYCINIYLCVCVTTVNDTLITF